MTKGTPAPSQLPGTLPPGGDLVGHLVQQMERMVFSGELQPGEKLREQALADRLGVRRGPLREAIRILEGRRLIERVPNAGVRVIAPSLHDFEELLLTREALEGMAARLAAENMTLAEIQALRDMAAALEARDKPGSVSLGVINTGPDQDFHRHIALGSRNRRIAQWLCEDLYSVLRLFRVRAAQARSDPGITHAEHQAVIEAIHRRDPDAAESAMRRHVRRSRDTLLRSLKTPTH